MEPNVHPCVREPLGKYWLNATKIMDFKDPDPKGSREGIIGFRAHNGLVVTEEYRNIRILTLEPEQG